MPVSVDIQDLLEEIGRFTPGSPLDCYITSATFPQFKSIEPGMTVTFDFPLTALVGANGTGKSSILHALWGMPYRQSTSRFWFSTAVDPIQEGNEQQGAPRYFYSHYINAIKSVVQTRKVRISARKVGYWEPARASANDGMDPMPEIEKNQKLFRANDRWFPTKRKVIYINFKCEFSAFDRLFYFPPRGETLARRQTMFLAGATRLRRVIDRNLQSYAPGGKEAVFENRDLTQEELEWTGYILGREYKSARLVQHRLYGGLESPSVIFGRADKSYSEAFAGSGELAIVRAVVQILAADEYSLILLDEPETSLHPGAQKRLLGFLLRSIQIKHTQIVISTHSPSLVELLPVKAIKVLEETPSGNSIVIIPSQPQVAFNCLGRMGERFTVAVEDALLLALVQMAERLLDAGERDAFDLYVPPGGASSILSVEVPLWLTAKRKVYVILDGDQKPEVPLPDLDALTEAASKKLGTSIFQSLKVKPLHVADGHAEPAKSYVAWISARVKFLDAICPEMVLLEGLIGLSEANSRAKTNQQAKTALIAEMTNRGHRTDASALSAAASFIVTPESTAYGHIESLAGCLREFLSDNATK